MAEGQCVAANWHATANWYVTPLLMTRFKNPSSASVSTVNCHSVVYARCCATALLDTRCSNFRAHRGCARIALLYVPYAHTCPTPPSPSTHRERPKKAQILVVVPANALAVSATACNCAH